MNRVHVVPRAAWVCGLLILPLAASAQQTPLNSQAAGTPHYDVVLEVPELSVGELELLVANLRAHLSLQANAASLVNISAGAVVAIDSVRLGLYGVLGEAYLYIDLDNVQRIVRRVVQTLDNNPEILTRVLQSADSLLRTVGGVADTALQPGGVVGQVVGTVGRTLEIASRPGGLLSQTVNALGQTVQQVVTQTGSLVELTLDSAGSLVNEKALGSVLDLPTVQTATIPGGRTVRTVRDTTGNLIDVTLDRSGRVLDAVSRTRR
jgi:hypothetical protein